MSWIERRRLFQVAMCALLLCSCDLMERAFQLIDHSGESIPNPGSSAAIEESELVPADKPRVAGIGGSQSASGGASSLAAAPNGAPDTFADLATASNPGVVFVRTLKGTRRGSRRVLGESNGSGFVFDTQGKILTNYHVVRGARAIQVEFQDGRALMAEVVGADPLTDLAILQVAQKGLFALNLGDSDRIRVGDWVIAIGNPYGLEHTVSAGIISAKERTGRDVDLGNTEAYYSFLQTDASINPGNSGGPLLDLRGDVVGINTAINQGANNIGFAIPINMVKRLLPRLLKDGHVKRAAIGVQVADVSHEDTARFALPNRNGAFVARVVSGGPAHRAGMRMNDVIVDFDGQPIKNPDQLRWQTSLAPIGADVPLAVLRDGVRVKMMVQPAPLRAR